MTRAQELDAFGLLVPQQLMAMVETAATVEETHQVGRLALVLFGTPTAKPVARRTDDEADVALLHDRVHAVRRRLTTAALSDEEREAVHRQRELEVEEHNRIQVDRRRGEARDRAADRQRQGGYLLPHERALLTSA